jgi:hypothetical protein
VAIRRRARRRNALLFLFVALIAGFFAVAFVHAELVAGQYELDAVRAQISQTEARHAELARLVEEASAPDVIVGRATELGMVRAHQPVYLVASAPIRDVEVVPFDASITDPRSMVAAPVLAADDNPAGTEGSSPGPCTNGACLLDEASAGGAEGQPWRGDGSQLPVGTFSATVGIMAGVSADGRLPQPPTLALDAPAGDAGGSGVAGSGVAGAQLAGSPGAPSTTLAGAAGSASGARGRTGVDAGSVGRSAAGLVVGVVTGSVDQGGSVSGIAGTRAVSGGTGSG